MDNSAIMSSEERFMNMRNDYINQKNCNFRIHLPESNGIIDSHREVLSKYSLFFDTFFRFNNLNNCIKIKIYGINEKNLQLIITSMYFIEEMEPYFVKLNLSDDRVLDLLVIADYLQAVDIYSFLLSHLLERLSITSFTKLIHFYQIHNKTSMIKGIVEFIIGNFETIFSDRSTLTDVPVGLLKQVCKSDELSCSESLVCKTVLDWLKSNIIDDADKNELLYAIRYAWISKEFLSDCLEKYEGDRVIREFLTNAIHYHLLPLHEQNLIPSGEFNRPRQGRIKIYHFDSFNMSMSRSHDESKQNPESSNGLVSLFQERSNFRPFMQNPVVLEYSSDGEHIPNQAASHMWTWHNNQFGSFDSLNEEFDVDRRREDTQVIYINGIPYILIGFPNISHNQLTYF